jgi:hypothetical protein
MEQKRLEWGDGLSSESYSLLLKEHIPLYVIKILICESHLSFRYTTAENKSDKINVRITKS